jgi:NTP pyrophosphatase (non-canonical NTP hydrolase)
VPRERLELSRSLGSQRPERCASASFATWAFTNFIKSLWYNPKKMSERETIGQKEVEAKFKTLDEMQDHLKRVFSERDNIYLPGRKERIDLLTIGIGDLSRTVFKGYPREDLEGSMARVVSRIFCLARSVDEISVAEGMFLKYPKEGCAYCGRMPCVCGSERPGAKLGNGSIEQRTWSMREWQKHLAKVYSPRNNQMGIYYILTRLNMERDEFTSLEDDIKKIPLSIDEAKRNYNLELTDTLSWVMAGATLYGVDLQEAVEDRYGNGCKKCGGIPCKCGPHDLTTISDKKKKGID